MATKILPTSAHLSHLLLLFLFCKCCTHSGRVQFLFYAGFIMISSSSICFLFRKFYSTSFIPVPSSCHSSGPANVTFTGITSLTSLWIEVTFIWDLMQWSLHNHVLHSLQYTEFIRHIIIVLYKGNRFHNDIHTCL